MAYGIFENFMAIYNLIYEATVNMATDEFDQCSGKDKEK